MVSAGTFLYVLMMSSFWLTGSGLVLWLCLRSRLQISSGTRAVASILVVLQGWIWFGIPVELDSAWVWPHTAAAASQEAAPVYAARAQRPPPFNARSLPGPQPYSDSTSISGSVPLSDPASLRAVKSIPNVIPIVGVAAYGIWMAGIAILLWRSIRGFLALSEMVHALPFACAEWQNELSALCEEQSIGSRPVLKVGDVAAPLLVKTWRSACIVIPAWLWESCAADQRTSILLHELAHYRRGDLWRQLAMRLLVLPHWFNPVAWWAASQFAAASEDACDDAATGGDDRVAISYCKVLLVLNERLCVPCTPALAISGSSLTERVCRILHPESHKESQMSRSLILATMIVLTSLATIRIQAAAQSPPTKNEAAKDETAKASDQSLIANGGFEEPQEESDDPESWFATRVPMTAGHFLMSASKSIAHGGKRSAFIEIGGSHPNMPVFYNWTAVANGWKAGETYELSGWIKTEDARHPADLMVQFWSGEGRNAKSLGSATTEKDSPVKGTTDWKRVSTRLKVPEGTDSVRIRAGLSSQGNRGAKAWFDDISLVKVASN